MPKRPRNVCVFRGGFIREQVDPRIQLLWRERTGVPAPFGDLRRIWRQRHCSEVNPYGSETCPYREEDCALAFFQAVETSLSRSSGNPVGYFRAVALTMGQVRAEQKPLARNAMMPNDGTRPGDPSGMGSSPATGPDVPRPKTRPTAIGDLLGSLDLGPRPRPADDGKASAKR